MTDYVILSKDDSGFWSEAARASARSTAAAIKALVESAKSPGEYVAVPARSWKPVTVTVETTSTVKFK